MMKIAGKVVFWMKKTLKTAMVGTALGFAYSQAALAGDMPSNMDFWYVSNSSEIKAYDEARDYLDQPVYKDTEFAKGSNSPIASSPLISVAEYDLNKDGTLEILAFPMEVSDGSQFCRPDDTCPYYILQRTKDGLKNLGVIYSYILNHGEDVRNGYVTIEAHTKMNDPDYFELYVFDPLQSSYVPEAMVGAAKPLPAENPKIPDTLGFWLASNNKEHVSYDIARNALDKPVYAGTTYAKSAKNGSAPLIRVADFDLNGDKDPETIASPFNDQAGHAKSFCAADGLCPYYILQTVNGKVRTLGKIDAQILNRGDNIQNGYWTLKAYPKAEDPTNFTTYVYDKAEKTYKPAQAKPPAAKP